MGNKKELIKDMKPISEIVFHGIVFRYKDGTSKIIPPSIYLKNLIEGMVNDGGSVIDSEAEIEPT